MSTNFVGNLARKKNAPTYSAEFFVQVFHKIRVQLIYLGLSNKQRSKILRDAVQVLVSAARNELPDRFAEIEELGSRSIFAIDAT